MKKVLSCLFVIFLFLILSLFSKTSSTQKMVSPVLGISKIKISNNIWLPQDNFLNIFLNAPKITSQAAFFVEVNTGKVLFARNERLKLPIASLVKIMTAIVSLDIKDMEDQIDVSQRSADMEPDKMLLKVGEKLTVKDLLQGIFLVSANDAAEALAEKVTSSREDFISLMNKKALQIGMKDTLFINPTGLEEDPSASSGQVQQYSTAYDVVLMSRYLIKHWPEILDITSKDHIFIPETEYHQDYDLYSGINLLDTYPGVIGLKTGFTPEAGLTLVTVAKKDGKEIIGVLLGSTNRRDDAKELLDYSFKRLN